MRNIRHVSTIFLILIIFLVIYFYINSGGQYKPIERVDLPPPLSNISDFEYLDLISAWDTVGCTTPLNESNKTVVNIIHIKKFSNDSFQIDCKRGLTYKNLVDNHLGKFPNCDEALAKKIDETLRSKSSYFTTFGKLVITDLEKACFVPVMDIIPDYVVDYYLFVLDCRKWNDNDLNSWSSSCFNESIPIGERHRLAFLVVDGNNYTVYS